MRTGRLRFSIAQAVLGAAWCSAALLCVVASPVSAANDCAANKPLPPATVGATSLPPVSDELALVDARSARQVSVDQAVAHMQYQQCRSLANAAPANAPTASAGGNSFRFNMTQNGKRMTADEFDAWMKSQGVRVVKGPTPPAAQAAPPPPPPAAPAKKKKR